MHEKLSERLGIRSEKDKKEKKEKKDNYDNQEFWNEINELNNRCTELIFDEKYGDALKRLKEGESLLEVGYIHIIYIFDIIILYVNL